MAANEPQKPPSTSPDRLFRGVLVKLGDIFDGMTGRKYQPSSSLATSELAERIKRLLDSEARDVPGKGKVVPHLITLKMQWDKFSADGESAIPTLENELLIATIDHINDSRYYTEAPVHVEVKPDYFTEGVKLLTSFDTTSADSSDDAELDLDLAGKPEVRAESEAVSPTLPASSHVCAATFTLEGEQRTVKFRLPEGGRISVGRTAESKLQLDDPSVSKHHAVVALRDGALTVADTGSTNGTFIRGERIAYGAAIAVDSGEEVKFGVVPVAFELEEIPDDGADLQPERDAAEPEID